MTIHDRRDTQLGLTLIELMVSIVLGLVVVGAVTYLYVGSRGAYRGNESLARIQEAGRFGLDSITRDVRRSGALGCGSLVSVGNGGGPVAINVIARPPSGATPAALAVDVTTTVQGFAPASYAAPTTPTGWTAIPGAPAYRSGDILQLQITSGTPVRVIGNPDPVGATIPIADNSVANFKIGDYAVLANCSAATVFRVTDIQNGAGTSKLLGFGVGTVAAGGNGTVGGGVPLLNLPQQPGFAFDSYSTVQHFDQVTYYIGTVPNSVSAGFPTGRPALYRFSVNSQRAEDVVENIEDMDVVYGIATTAPPANVSASADLYEHAGLMAAGDWTNVVGIRVSLMAVGDQLGQAQAALSIPFRSDPTVQNSSTLVAYLSPDTRLRQVFTGTAAVRDRIK